MKKWLKRLVFALVFTAFGVLLALAAGWYLLSTAPEWYQPMVSYEAHADAARRAEDKLVSTRTSLDESHLPRTTMPVAPVEVAITQEELNAVFLKWANWHNWKQNYENYITDPAIILQPGRLILAGKLHDLNSVVSLHLEPRLDDRGNLDLRLTHIMGGRLPLPDALIDPYRRDLTNLLESALHTNQAKVRVDPSGATNSAACTVAGIKLLLNILNNAPADSTLLVPLDPGHGVAVRLTNISIRNGSLTLILTPIAPSEHQPLLHRLKEPYALPMATAR